MPPPPSSPSPRDPPLFSSPLSFPRFRATGAPGNVLGRGAAQLVAHLFDEVLEEAGVRVVAAVAAAGRAAQRLLGRGLAGAQRLVGVPAVLALVQDAVDAAYAGVEGRRAEELGRAVLGVSLTAGGGEEAGWQDDTYPFVDALLVHAQGHAQQVPASDHSDSNANRGGGRFYIGWWCCRSRPRERERRLS